MTFNNLQQKIWSNKKVLLTTGPTREPIDPVRFISNHSSGKMGFAIAECLYAMGAQVHVVSGPVSIGTVLPEQIITRIETAHEMFEAVMERLSSADVVIFAAAVADFSVASVSDSKIKRNGKNISLELVPNPDIAGEVSRRKRPTQMTVGFALETDDCLNHATNKLKRKGFDFIVLNVAGEQGVGFGFDTNQITIIDRDGNIVGYDKKSKKDVASDIVTYLFHRMVRVTSA